MTFPYPASLKWFRRKRATIVRVYFFILLQALIAPMAAKAAEVPHFRKVETVPQPAPQISSGSLRLLADAEFPPFSFLGADGRPAGLSVDLALLACGELKIRCLVETRPFAELVPALLRKEGDVIVSGLRLDEKLLSTIAMTRPYFWSFGRFGNKKSQPIAKPDPATLSALKIGVIEGSGHAAWIEKYYSDATLTPFKSEAELHAALKTGAVDVVFEDNLRLVFWLGGSDSGGCCKALGGPFMDRGSFSHNLAFLARRDDSPILKAFDMALDRLQQNGTTSKVMTRYLPEAFW